MANIAYIQITRQCNQECRFCSNPPTEKTTSLSKAKRLIDLYLRWGYRSVIFSGGEPTLYPYLAQIIAYARRKKMECRIITNGQKMSDKAFVSRLVDAGLRHVVQSVYSDDPAVHDALAVCAGSHQRICQSLNHYRDLGLTVDIATVINKYNAGHLSRTVRWLIKEYPFIRHYIWNNLDPAMNRATVNTDTIPALADFEVELPRAMLLLHQTGRTFRVERVPLCYMGRFAHCSTEARKIVKQEERTIYFLDKKGLKRQTGWTYLKTARCRICTLSAICPGLYMLGKYFSPQELYPVFIPPEPIIENIKAT